MKVIDSGYTNNTLREKLRDDWDFEDDEYENRILYLIKIQIIMC